MGRPLWWEDGSVICSAMNDTSSISGYITTDGLLASSSTFQFLCLTITLFLLGVGLPHPYPPRTGWSNPKSKWKAKATLVQGEVFYVTIGRAAWEACSAMWNLGTNSVFALGPRKTTENLVQVGRSHDPPDANQLLASSPAPNLWALTLVSICAVVFLLFDGSEAASLTPLPTTL
jgi:hypothetical protein